MAMTAKQKKLRAAARESLRAQGVIPPPKKPLNRKKFIEEAREDFNKTINLDDIACILTALSEMTAHGRSCGGYDLEAVGAAKAMKIACEYKRFIQDMKQQGRSDYTIGEYIERLNPIYNA